MIDTIIRMFVYYLLFLGAQKFIERTIDKYERFKKSRECRKNEKMAQATE